MLGRDSSHSLYGMQIYASPIALERQVPVRTHKMRRGQTEAYHRRVQKKWTKRFGTKTERYALMMNPQAIGLAARPGLVLDPRDVAMLKMVDAK